eukprot:403346188
MKSPENKVILPYTTSRDIDHNQSKTMVSPRNLTNAKIDSLKPLPSNQQDKYQNIQQKSQRNRLEINKQPFSSKIKELSPCSPTSDEEHTRSFQRQANEIKHVVQNDQQNYEIKSNQQLSERSDLQKIIPESYKSIKIKNLSSNSKSKVQSRNLQKSVQSKQQIQHLRDIAKKSFNLSPLLNQTQDKRKRVETPDDIMSNPRMFKSIDECLKLQNTVSEKFDYLETSSQKQDNKINTLNCFKPSSYLGTKPQAKHQIQKDFFNSQFSPMDKNKQDLVPNLKMSPLKQFYKAASKTQLLNDIQNVSQTQRQQKKSNVYDIKSQPITSQKYQKHLKIDSQKNYLKNQYQGIFSKSLQVIDSSTNKQAENISNQTINMIYSATKGDQLDENKTFISQQSKQSKQSIKSSQTIKESQSASKMPIGAKKMQNVGKIKNMLSQSPTVCQTQEEDQSESIDIDEGVKIKGVKKFVSAQCQDKIRSRSRGSNSSLKRQSFSKQDLAPHERFMQSLITKTKPPIQQANAKQSSVTIIEFQNRESSKSTLRNSQQQQQTLQQDKNPYFYVSRGSITKSAIDKNSKTQNHKKFDQDNINQVKEYSPLRINKPRSSIEYMKRSSQPRNPVPTEYTHSQTQSMSITSSLKKPPTKKSFISEQKSQNIKINKPPLKSQKQLSSKKSPRAVIDINSQLQKAELNYFQTTLKKKKSQEKIRTTKTKSINLDSKMKMQTASRNTEQPEKLTQNFNFSMKDQKSDNIIDFLSSMHEKSNQKQQLIDLNKIPPPKRKVNNYDDLDIQNQLDFENEQINDLDVVNFSLNELMSINIRQNQNTKHLVQTTISNNENQQQDENLQTPYNIQQCNILDYQFENYANQNQNSDSPTLNDINKDFKQSTSNKKQQNSKSKSKRQNQFDRDDMMPLVTDYENVIFSMGDEEFSGSQSCSNKSQQKVINDQQDVVDVNLKQASFIYSVEACKEVNSKPSPTRNDGRLIYNESNQIQNQQIISGNSQTSTVTNECATMAIQQTHSKIIANPPLEQNNLQPQQVPTARPTIINNCISTKGLNSKAEALQQEMQNIQTSQSQQVFSYQTCQLFDNISCSEEEQNNVIDNQSEEEGVIIYEQLL